MAENSPAGALITRLDATDADSGEFGELRYELRGFGSERFSVNSSTGDLSVGLCGINSCLDYEEQDTYTVTYNVAYTFRCTSTCTYIPTYTYT